jgi:hypothetical protein
MSLIEFNVYVNLFNKITEFDVRNDYSITTVKTYVYKKLNINHTNFIMYFGDKKLDYGIIGDYNIKEDMIINIYPKLNTGISKNINKNINDIKYDSIDEVKVYIQNNINDKNDKNDKKDIINEYFDINNNINNNINIENMNTHNKLQELLKKINKK